MVKKYFILRKRRVFYINEQFEKELGKNYFFDGTNVYKNEEILKNCSTWEKMVIVKIFENAIKTYSGEY